MIRFALALSVALASAAPALAAADPAQVEHGHQVFEYWCATCHGPGIGNYGVKYLPGTNALMTKYKGAKPALLSERTDLPPELVKYFVRNGISIMPYFRKTEISDTDLDALADYIARNLKQ